MQEWRYSDDEHIGAAPPPDPHRHRYTAPTGRLTAVGPPAAVTRREIEMHGQATSFLEAGAGSGGPTVVMLHGLASGAHAWESVLSQLGRHTHMIARTLGHGQSAKPASGDYSLGAYAAEVRDLLLVLGLDRATAVGHSFGGGVAMQYAYQFPELVERVVLVSSGGLGSDIGRDRSAGLPASPRSCRLSADRACPLPSCASGGSAPTPIPGSPRSRPGSSCPAGR